MDILVNAPGRHYLIYSTSLITLAQTIYKIDVQNSINFANAKFETRVLRSLGYAPERENRVLGLF